MRKPKNQAMSTASIRDFGGGWNVADAEYNLSSRFLTVADNVAIGIDNSLGPRPGYKFFADARGLTQTKSNPVTASLTFTANSGGYIVVTHNSHGLASGQHVTFSGHTASIGGIPVEELNETFGVRVIDGSTYHIQTRTTGSGSSTRTVTYYTDNYIVNGNIIECTVFQGYLILFMENGEIGRVNLETKQVERIWSISLAYATAGNPRGWSPSKYYSFDTWRQTLLVVNGRDGDKPIEIDNTNGTPTQYLIDPATTSNTFVYPADFIQTQDNFVILYGANNVNTPSSNTPTVVEISAEGTSGVFTGNSNPDDAVQIDLGRYTTTIDPRITGIGAIRNNVFVGFNDTSMLGSVGVFEGSTHKPKFDDQIPQHGTLNSRVIQNVGNDLFMCDYVGVPAFSQSAVSGAIVPDRLSQLIDPAIIKHFARLSDDTLRYKVWSVYNTRDRQYMLFAPKFDENSQFFINENGIYTQSDLASLGVVLVQATAHTVSSGDFILISGATDIVGLPATAINGRRRVISVLDNNSFLLEVGQNPAVVNQSGGGSAMVAAPIDDETIAYVYQFNPSLKIRRWMRYRGLDFDCGAVAKDGSVFFCKGTKIYQWGTNDRQYYADALDDWDYVWAAGVNYKVGDRVKLSNLDLVVYECLVDHTSSGDFNTNVVKNEGVWAAYSGREITWVAEGPWADYGKRMYKKINKYIQCDATGLGKFEVLVFTDNIYQEISTDEVAVEAALKTGAISARRTFVGKDVGGFGLGTQAFGGGLRTREQHNFEFPFEGFLAKMRFSGKAKEPLKIVGIMMLYHLGNIYP